MHHRVNILGTQVSSITASDLFSDFKAAIQNKKLIQVAITPVNSILAAHKNPKCKRHTMLPTMCFVMACL
jgi:UDP-N-acetyl-D-mannosaminuronic acid transferase (WecB/TagA/CpsF family)